VSDACGELRYTITPAHTRRWVDEALEREMRRDDALAERLGGMQQRAVLPMLMLLPACGAGWLLIHRGATPETWMTLALAALLLVPAWRVARPFTARLRRTMAQQQTDSTAGGRPVRRALAELTLTTRFKRLQGDYRVHFDAQGMQVVRAGQRSASLRWSDVVHVRETEAFLVVACTSLHRRGQAYWIPKHSAAMDPEVYREGMQGLLGHCRAVAATV